MATKVLVVLLASHCVPATDMMSLIASNYAKVYRTGSITNTETDTKSNGKLYDDRPQWDAALTTEASDLYNVYYPVMEAQVVTDGNDTGTALHTPLIENSRTTPSESPISVLRLNPLAAFINAFFRQPVYVADSDEETSESAYGELSSRSDTTDFPFTINQPRFAHDPSAYAAESPGLHANGRTAKYMDEGYTELLNDEQSIEYATSRQYLPPDGKTFPLLGDAHEPTELDETYKQNDPIQHTTLESPYEMNRSYQSAIPKVPEFYSSATSRNPYALNESHRLTTSEYPYEVIEEEIHNSTPPDEGDKKQDSHAYVSLTRKESVEAGNSLQSQSLAPAPQKHHTATGREKNPYTYFYVGRKLWYIPLFFSVYFMLYVLALVVRSISRHKIVFPATKTKYEKRELNSGLEDITYNITTALERTQRMYL